MSIAAVSNFKKELVDVVRYRYVIYSFVNFLLRARYRRSFFGFLWTVIAPLSSYILLSIVFSFAMRLQMKNYLVYLLAGLVLFNFISAVIGKAVDIFIGNEHFLKKISVPKSIFAFNVVFFEAVNFLCSIFVFVGIGLVTGHLQLSVSQISILVPALSLVFLLSGLGIIIGIATVYFRDLKQIIPSLMLIIFYLTPIIYPLDLLPSSVQGYMKYNLFYYFVSSFRDPLVTGAWPSIESLGIVASSGLIAFVLGILTLNKFGNRIVLKL